MASRSLHFDKEWRALLRDLVAHLGSTKGSLILATINMAVIPVAVAAVVPVPVVPPAAAEMPEITMTDAVPLPVMPPQSLTPIMRVG